MVVYVTIEYNHIPAVIESLVPEGNQAVKSYAETARDLAKAFVPVRTGHLKGSITTQQVGPLDYETYTDVEYARFVEWGTRFMRAQPFMAPAAQTALGELPRIGTEFGDGVEHAALIGRIR